MQKYIKSYSNFILKSKHKSLDDGTIFERDYTTIGGRDNMTSGQVPIFRDGNFLITVNNDIVPTKPYSVDKWLENQGGTSWTYGDVENVSENTEFKDNKIVLKTDYYKLSDFAYYGSCSELVRGSVNGILSRFPGELFISNNMVNSLPLTPQQSSVVKENYAKIQLNGEDKDVYEVDNPFNIDVWTKWSTEHTDEAALKYFSANDNFSNYNVIDTAGTIYDITSVTVENVSGSCCNIEITEDDSECDLEMEDDDTEKSVSLHRNLSTAAKTKYKTGDVMFETIITYGNGQTLTLYTVKYYNDKLVFAESEGELHIRPTQKHQDKFFNELDSFESVLLKPSTEPKYKASFQVVHENEKGYYSTIEDFIFPIGRGGYNIGGNTQALSNYLSKFLEVSDFYDERFSDNLYRMMTHESIKNMDWSRNIPDPNHEAYEEGGQKISQLIRLFGREFDEIKFYIDGINNYNTITYDDRTNIPDYFMTDVLEIDGWDINNIYPLEASLFKCVDSKKIKYELDADSSIWTANSADNVCLLHTFNQMLDNEIKPYEDNGSEENPSKYFLVCNGMTGENGCYQYGTISADTKYYVDNDVKSPRTSVVRQRMSKYTSDKSYSYKDVNSVFLKRLKLNSREILRHKGTIQGVEMMLGLFGLKSDKFDSDNYDYTITEYASLTDPIIDEYWDCKGMNRINWYNSTKAIQYNTLEYINGQYTDYQGLPVAYKNKYMWKRGNDKGVEITNIKEVISYNPETFELKYITTDNDFTITSVTAYRDHVLYPYFDNNAIIDGSPYYQMDGGWIKNSPYMFDVNNNIVYGENLYTETVDTRKIVSTIEDLINTPMVELKGGEIYKVNSLKGEYLLIHGYLYEIEQDYKGKKYINVKINNGVVKVGNMIFSDTLYVSNPYMNNGNLKGYTVSLMNNGDYIKIYLTSDNKIVAQDFAGEDSSYNYVNPSSVKYVNNGIFTDGLTSDNATHYFRIINPVYKDNISSNGWVQLKITDEEYIKLNTLENYFNGNNPHNGNLVYDGGFAYMDYFANLFNYAYNNDLFDERPYRGTFEEELAKIKEIGFKKLVDEENKTYNKFADSKIHFFGEKFDTEDMMEFSLSDEMDSNEFNVLKDDFEIEDDKKDSSYQIVNNKKMKIVFYLLNSPEENKYSLEEIKYFQSVVMPYVAQMIPSDTILEVEYIKKN